MSGIAIFNNEISGKILFSQNKKVLNIQIDLQGFEPDKDYAIHIHEFGDLSQGCKSLGGHFNPTMHHHGSDLYQKHHHAGDLMNNIHSDQNGKVKLEFQSKCLSISYKSSKCILGRSVVIHKYSDDCGQKGILQNDVLIPYQEMSLKQLQKISKQRGYPSNKTKKQLADKLDSESLVTGNAGGRMACAIIGLASKE